MADGIDEAREAFAQEIPQATRQRDQSGRFVSTSSKPEPIFQPREVEGDTDGGADPRLLEMERKAADGRSEEGDAPQKPAKRPAEDEPEADDEPTEHIGEEPEEDEDKDKPETPPEDGPKYEIEVDGEKREVTLTEALRGYQREETFNHRMRQMVEIAKTIDQRGAEAQGTRDAYINLCQRQEQEFAALIPKEPDWDALYKENPAGAHALEQNFKHVYGTLNAIRQRRAQAEQEAYHANAQRTADYARAEFDKFCSRNKLANQTERDAAIAGMRRTLIAHGFSEDEIGTTYDERMLSVALKASKYDKMVANKPFPVQPERGGALQPGSAPRVGNGQARTLNDAQKRLASSGRVDDAAAVMAQLIGGRR